MDEQDYGSVLFSKAVEAFAQLPGVGPRTAQRYALHMLEQPAEQQARFVAALRDCADQLQRCPRCNGFSDTGEACARCADTRRDDTLLCVVADVRDVMALERAGQYRGRYFVLGGLIDPMAGRGPDQLPLDQLQSTIARQRPEELILAFAVNMEGDTTAFYLQRHLQSLNIRISTPARGIPFGERLDQADEQTLASALQDRRVLYTPAAASARIGEMADKL
ncbi:MAG: recombination protein RecR [Bacteroidia bacterium]|nr:MAG: recombination protein RecR [Bacteroidia bacterium]